MKLRFIAIVISFLATIAWSVNAADQEFVGALALVIEEDVARQLGLSETTRRQLIDFIDEREADALELALSLRDLPADERSKQLAPFRKQSEELGLKLLTARQRGALESIRIGRAGMRMLGEQKIAKRLKLSDEQRARVDDLLRERKDSVAGLSRSAAEKVQESYDRQLKLVLTSEQTVLWNGMTNPESLSADVARKTRDRQEPSQSSISASALAGSKLRFSFRYAPWSDVIEWFAARASLSLIMDAPPQGTFNYTDSREYTPAQAIDLLNSVLLTKGYTLVRRDQMLMVINLEDGIPPNLITEVPLEELDRYGEYELVRCLFTLRSTRAEDAEEEISRLLGPQGKVDLLASANQLAITETAGRLRTFRKILQASETKNSLGNATTFSLQFVRANTVIESWRKLMGVPEEENAIADGSLRVAKGRTSKQLVATGEAHRVGEFADLVRILDAPVGGGAGIDAPQIEVYPVTDADPASVLSVMEELLVDSEEVRLATDPKTGSLVALATPQEHATIRATIDQMQQDGRLVEVIRLRSVDPQLAMLSIEKLFGPEEGSEEPDSNAPRVDANPMTRSLLIRGSAAQIRDIRTLLVKMGEDDSEKGGRGLGSGRGNLRVIPVNAAMARRAMEQLNAIWPTVRKNRIRTVTPSSSIRGLRPADRPLPKLDEAPPSSPRTRNSGSRPTLERGVIGTQSDDVTSTSQRGSLLHIPGAAKSHYVVNQLPATRAARGDDDGTQPPDIIVTLGDQGLLIASEDTEALDEFEQLFGTLSDRLFTGSRELAIYYLKYAKADVAAEFLKQFVGGGGAGASSGGTLLGNLAGAALGGGGGGIMGSLLGLGGGNSSSARISGGTTVIADPRLNAVVVQATPKELDFIEDLLKVLDTATGPERIETVPRPRAIPILNADVDEIANIVRSVYATRLAGTGGQQARQPSPEDFIRAMSGQKNTGRSIQDSVSEQVRITVSVDKRRNVLLVVAPDSTFREIEELVRELDFAVPELTETIRYGRAAGSSPEIIRGALTTIIGEEQVTADETDNRASTPKKEATDGSRQQRNGIDEMRRRMEFLRALQTRAAKEQAAAKKKALKSAK